MIALGIMQKNLLLLVIPESRMAKIHQKFWKSSSSIHVENFLAVREVQQQTSDWLHLLVDGD